MTAFYNEIDRDAAHVLRCLIADGLIAPGVVDERSVKDIQPHELAGFTQCHFFAGAGLWSVAARMAGWPDDRPLWTGSCPCQPFSAAGRGLGTDDPRHLWPDFFRLIRACRPPVVMGEQVAGAPGYGWLDGVRADLEGEGYASRAVDIPACAVDAPHIRSRLYWCAVADAVDHGRQEVGASHVSISGQRAAFGRRAVEPAGPRPDDGSVSRRLRQANGEGCAMADADQPLGRIGDEQPARQQPQHEQDAGTDVRAGSRNGSAWAGACWIACHDGKARRTEPGLRLLVDGMAGRVPAWRLAGNSISPVLAAEVIGAFLDAEAAIDFRLTAPSDLSAALDLQEGIFG